MAGINTGQDAVRSVSPDSCFLSTTLDTPKSNTTICLPKKFDELNQLLNNFSYHQASQLVGSSLKAYRNPYEAMVVLYGVTGHGKSSTLNHLFKTDIIPTCDYRSCTQDVIEYVVTMDSPHWNVKELEIGFVDTPGFGDTASDAKNIENLAKIDNFISNHPFLRSPFSQIRIYPNIVMIIVNADDKRLGDLNSQFAKMLRMLSKFKIVDKVRPNVVIVLTHAMSIRPHSKYLEKINKKLEFVDYMTRLYFGLSFPIVFIDNELEDLESHGDWTLLPDGTRQPLNLFDAMISLMKQSGDEIGIETIRLLFKSRRNIEIHTKRQMGSSEGIFKGINCQPDVSKWKKLFESEFKFSYSSEVSNSIRTCIEEKRFPDLSSLAYEMVLPLMHRLEEVKLVKASDLSRKNIEEVKRQLFPFCMNKQEIILMFELFTVKPLDCLDFHLLGCGVFPHENILKFPIFSTKGLKYCNEIGNCIPENTQYTSRGSLLVHCRCRQPKEGLFSRGTATISFAIQYELFNVAFDLLNINCQQMENAFTRTVNSLPRYTSEQPNNRIANSYSSFIDKYGTHCVFGVSYGGEISGSIQINLEPNMTSDDFSKLSLDMKYLLWIHFETLHQEDSIYFQGIDPYSMNLYYKLLNSPIKWRGGEKRYHVPKLIDLNSVNWNKWKVSVCNEFILLESIVHVCKMDTLLRKLNIGLAISFIKAQKELFQNEKPVKDMYFFVYDDPDRNSVLNTEGIESVDVPTTILTRELASENAKSDGTSLCKII